MKASCDVSGCDYTFTHADPNQVKRVMGVHKAKKHGIAGKAASSQYEAKKKLEGETRKSESAEVFPNFCPNCACNLAAIKAAMNLRRR